MRPGPRAEVGASGGRRQDPALREPPAPQGRLLSLAVLDGGCARRPDLCRGARRHRREGSRRDAAAHRGGAAPVAEDGSRRPAHRRHRPRLQQSAARHRRLARPGAEAAGRRAAERDPALRQRRHDLGQPRRRADASAAGVLPPPAPRSQAAQGQPADRFDGGPAAPHDGREDRSSSWCWPAGCGRRCAIRTSSRTASSIWRSTRAMRCRTAAGSRSRPATRISITPTRPPTATSTPANTSASASPIPAPA